MGIDGVADDIEAAAVVPHDEIEARERAGSWTVSVVINGGAMSPRTWIPSVLLSPCAASTPVPGLVSTDDIDGDGDALDKSGMVGEDDMAVMTTPGCFFLLGCFCDSAGFLLEAVLLLAVELTLMLTLRAEDDRRWSRSLWRSLFERETRGGSKSPRRGSSGLVGLRSDMLRNAKDGYGWIASESELPDGGLHSNSSSTW